MPPVPRRSAHPPSRAFLGAARSTLVALGCAAALSAASASATTFGAPGTGSLSPVAASAVPAETRAFAALMAETGTDAQIDKVAKSLSAQMIAEAEAQVASGSVEPTFADAVRREAPRSFTAEAFRHSVTEAFGDALDAADGAEVLAFYRTPLGKRLVGEGLSHDLEDGGVAFMRFVMALEQDPEKEARRANAKAMEAALDAGRWAADVAVDTQLALVAGLAFSVPVHERERVNEVLAAIEAQRARQVETMRDFMVDYLAFSHENFSLAELDALLAFQRTPAAQRFGDATLVGFGSGIRAASLAFGDRLGMALTLAEASDEI